MRINHKTIRKTLCISYFILIIPLNIIGACHYYLKHDTVIALLHIILAILCYLIAAHLEDKAND
jgi:hypothetical protein